MLHDLRFALRSLFRNPAFTAVAVLTIAVGIGATTAVFSVVESIVLRPLPFRDADRLVDISYLTKEGTRLLASWFDLVDLRLETEVFQDVAARTPTPSELVLTDDVVEPGPFTTELFPTSPRPEDADGRAATYPEAAHEVFAGMGTAFEGMFNDPGVPTDPLDVVRRFHELIDMPPGTRPFRSVVGVDLGVADRNATAEVHEAPFLEMLGLDGFARLAV